MSASNGGVKIPFSHVPKTLHFRSLTNIGPTFTDAISTLKVTVVNPSHFPINESVEGFVPRITEGMSIQ